MTAFLFVTDRHRRRSGSTAAYHQRQWQALETVNGIEVIGGRPVDVLLYKGHVDINARTHTLKQDGGDWYLRSESDDVPDDGGDVLRRTMAAMSLRRLTVASKMLRRTSTVAILCRTTVAMIYSAGRWRRRHRRTMAACRRRTVTAISLRLTAATSRP